MIRHSEKRHEPGWLDSIFSDESSRIFFYYNGRFQVESGHHLLFLTRNQAPFLIERHRTIYIGEHQGLHYWGYRLPIEQAAQIPANEWMDFRPLTIMLEEHEVRMCVMTKMIDEWMQIRHFYGTFDAKSTERSR